MDKRQGRESSSGRGEARPSEKFGGLPEALQEAMMIVKIVEEVSDCIWAIDPKTFKFTYISRAVEDQRGYTPKEAKEQSLFEILDGDSLKEVALKIKSVLDGEHPQDEKITLTSKIKCKDGGSMWGETTIKVIWDEEGEMQEIMGVTRDVTEREEMKELLNESRTQLEKVLNEAEVVLWVLDSEGVFRVSKGKGLDKLGLQPDEVVGSSVFEIYAGFEEILDNARKALDGEAVTYTTEVEERIFASSMTPLQDENDCVTSVIGVASDVTDAVKVFDLEAQVRQTQKMEELGRLLGGAVHDMNNILGGLLNGVELLQSSLPIEVLSNQELNEDFLAIKVSAERLKSLVSSFLQFARKQDLNLKSLDLNEVIERFTHILKNIVGKTCELEFDDQGNKLNKIKADQSQLEQVLLNLVINARDAMEKGGVIKMSAQNIAIDQEYCEGNLEAGVGDFVCFEVQDQGIGMSAEQCEKIFEPYFTTKPEGKGTGLGLAQVHKIVKEHNGWIEVDSTEGEGTTFKVFLPALKEVVECEESPLKGFVDGRGRLVLIIEDDDMVGATLKQIYTRSGFKVQVVTNALEAREILENSPTPDLIMCDVNLPGGESGSEFVNRLDGEIKYILMSGDKGAEVQGVPFMPKPIRLPTLATMVKSVLGD